MAMLAEPRQKRRYCLTPKGKPLFEDGDRFGTKMLEKMGWSKGKGLGKSEDGTQDFVRVKYKSDEKGLGFQVRDDQWTEHDKNFNGLLQNLNGNANNSAASPDDCEIVTPTVGLGIAVKSSNKKKLKEHISGQSLEENSKKSKARVHYKKFTKGKDMSQYSEKDLANIFGKKATTEETNIYSQFQAFNAGGSDSDANEDDQNKSVPESVKVLPPIINTGLSVNDYFKAKMDALKEKQGSSASSNPFNSNIRIINDVEVFVPSAKRKKSTDEDEEENDSSKKSKPLEVEEPQKQESGEVPRKKKKKSKKQPIESEESEIVPPEEINKEETRKKNKKRKKAAESEYTNIDEIKEQEEIRNGHHPDSNSESSSSKRNKKKSKKSQDDTTKNEEAPCVILEDDIPKKKKKKKTKISGVDPEETTENPSSIEAETNQNITDAKSKKKKNKKATEVSSHPKDLTSFTNNQQTNLLDTYNISTFCAEKFRNIEPHQFKGCNLMLIDGYGLSTDLKLDIKKIPGDAERIIRLWSGTLDKYTHNSSKHKLYSTYVKKVKLARESKHKIPALKFKSLKRKSIFQCV